MNTSPRRRRKRPSCRKNSRPKHRPNHAGRRHECHSPPRRCRRRPPDRFSLQSMREPRASRGKLAACATPPRTRDGNRLMSHCLSADPGMMRGWNGPLARIDLLCAERPATLWLPDDVLLASLQGGLSHARRQRPRCGRPGRCLVDALENDLLDRLSHAVRAEISVGRGPPAMRPSIGHAILSSRCRYPVRRCRCLPGSSAMRSSVNESPRPFSPRRFRRQPVEGLTTSIGLPLRSDQPELVGIRTSGARMWNYA